MVVLHQLQNSELVIAESISFALPVFHFRKSRNALAVSSSTFRFIDLRCRMSWLPREFAAWSVTGTMASLENDVVESNDYLITSTDPEHPANLICALCRNFYNIGMHISVRLSYLYFIFHEQRQTSAPATVL